MDTYISELFEDRLAGIQLSAWQRFLALFTESRSSSDISVGLDRMAAALSPAAGGADADAVRQKFAEISDLLKRE